MPPQRPVIVNPSQKKPSEMIFGPSGTDRSVFHSQPLRLAKKIAEVLGVDNPPDPSDFMNPLGVVRLGKNIAGAGLRDLRLSTGEMVRAVRELLEHGRFRAFHGTPNFGPLDLRRDPFDVGTIDAAIDRLKDWSPSGRLMPPNAQIFPVDVSFRGGLRGSRALHDPGRPVIGRPTDPLTDEVANAVRDVVGAIESAPLRAGRVQRPHIPEQPLLSGTPGYQGRGPEFDAFEEQINQSIRELNRGETEALLYRNVVEDPGSLSLSILDPVSTDVRIGDPLDVEKLFSQRESIGLPSRGSSSRDPLWKFKGR